jgi:ketosteroid isomerase-like protein
MDNTELIRKFYSAFSKRDHETMAECYHPDVHFKDEVFELSGDEVSKMWEMLCRRGKDLEITFTVDGDQARWEALYTFSGTGRKVHNIIYAEFEFKDGLIISHRDRFSFWRWSKHALGLPGYLLGWSSFLKKKVQSQAAKSLNAFISDYTHK